MLQWAADKIVIVPGGCRPEIKGYLAFRCDLQFQSPVRAKPVRRLIKLEIDLKDRYPLISGLQPPGTSIILVYNHAISALLAVSVSYIMRKIKTT